MRAAATRLGIPADTLDVRFAERADLAGLLSAADAGISFVRSTFSKLGSSPTKIGEYLACGLPIVANAGVGDVDRLVVDDGAGVLVSSFSEGELAASVCELLTMSSNSETYRALAEKRFDLRDAIDTYGSVYAGATGA